MRLLTDNRLVKSADRSFVGQRVVQMENDDAPPGIVDVKPASIGSSPYRWRYITRPLNLGLVGLAVAVALWGFAYKLSLYNPDQNQPAPIGVAKLWLGPEGTLLISRNGQKCQLHQRWTLDLVLTQEVEITSEAHNTLPAVPDAAYAGRNRFNDYKPRSPPPYMS
jgi:hypothetical protein